MNEERYAVAQIGGLAKGVWAPIRRHFAAQTDEDLASIRDDPRFPRPVSA